MANQEHNKVFLIVEDSPTARTVLAWMLHQDYGHTIQINFCNNEKEAIQQIQQTNIYTDVLINVDLCSKYGIELTKQQIEAASRGIKIYWINGTDEIKALMKLKGF